MFCFSTTLLATLLAAPSAQAADDDAPVPAKIAFGDSGDQWLRIITWAQVWGRAMELNPGSTVMGDEEDFEADIGIRRARVLMLGQISPRTHIVMHFGINNQTFNGARKPQMYIHDGWVQQEVVDKVLTVGAGLHYWHGVSRMTNASTLTFLAVDAPILNWVTIERTDQFARQMGVFAKGRLGGLDYRVALNKPFTVEQELVPGGMADYTANHSFAYAGYVQYMFGDKEANLVPYTVGTYLGKKSVFNIGAGAHFHPEATASLDADGTTTEEHDLLATGVDVFVDRPVGGGAVTAYGVWYHLDYGPDHVRNIGIMNVAAGGTSFNGAGNSYPVMGTGEHFYAQVGYLVPGKVGAARVQPYGTVQYSLMEGLDDPSTVYEAGANWYINGHNAKVTTHYRSRPIFEASGSGAITLSERASEGIVQATIMF